MKILHFSMQLELENYSELADLKAQFEILRNDSAWGPEQILKSNADVIELAPADFLLFKTYLKSLDVKTSRLGTADCLIRLNSDFRPIHLMSDAIYSAILKSVPDLKTSESAVVIGNFEFVLPMAFKLAQSGFFKLIIATDKISESLKIKKLIQTYAFNIEVTTVPLNELTQLESGSVLLISNLQKDIHPEAYESITYFNFLTRGATFVDVKSRNEPILAEEARRAEINVIEEVDVLRIKYQTILEIFKNSSLV